MPMYEYECKKCHKKFEVYKPIYKKDENEKCPYCGSEETKRLISACSSNVISCGTYFTGG